MRSKTLRLMLLLLLSLFAYPQKNQAPLLPGDYLGQRVPGSAAELFAPGIVSTGNHELDITVSPDLDEIYFTRSGQDWFSSVICYQRVDGIWQEPEVPSFVNENGANYPFITPDGKKIFFEMKGKTPGSDQAVEQVAVVERTKNGWTTPKTVHDNSADYRLMFVSVSQKGTLYFSANRKDGLGGFDIYRSEIAPDGSLHPENLGPAVNSEANEFHAFIAADESYLIFDSQNRPGGYGRNDLYISFRKEDGTWTKAENMGAEVNTDAGDMRPYVSPDGKCLFFCSDRANPRIGASGREMDYRSFMDRINGPGNLNQDIYWMDARIIATLKNRILKQQ